MLKTTTPTDVDCWHLVFDLATRRLFVRYEWEAAGHGGGDEFAAWSIEGMGVVIVDDDEGVDLNRAPDAGSEAGARQGPAGEDGGPDFHFVEPGGVGRGEVKMDVVVACQPVVVFGLVSVEVVPDDVNFSAGIFGKEAVHKVAGTGRAGSAGDDQP